MRDGLDPEPPRAHLSARAAKAAPEADDAPKVRNRVLRVWAAISTPLIIAIVVWLLVGNDTGYYWVGAAVGVLVVVGFESLARGRLLAFVGWAIIAVVGTTIVIGMVREWRLTLAVLLLVGAVVLLAQNLRELRSDR